MFTGSLALLHRALRLDARLLVTHLFRMAFAIVIYFCLLYLQAMSLRLGAPGLKLFETLSFLNLGLITLAGVSFFATAISEEKEEETLGLLKMAGLNPIGILLGKSTSRLLGAILLLLVQFPFTLLAITLGGVTLLQVVAAYFSLTAYMILLANVGLLSSVACRRGSNASSLTVLFLIAYFSCGFVISTIRLGLVNGGLIDPRGRLAAIVAELAEVAAEASVFTRLGEVMKTGFAGNPLGFQVVSNMGFAFVCFLLAWAGFNHFTRDWRSTSAESPIRGLKANTARIFRRRPKRDPVMWKEFHFITGGWRSLWMRFAVYGILNFGIFRVADRYYNYPPTAAAQGVVAAMAGLLVLEASLYVSRIFHDEWRDRTLPLLMMLPIATPRLVYSKVMGCLPALAPATFWLAVGSINMPDGFDEIVKTLLLPSRWFVVLTVLLFLTLTAFFSLVVKWGALPLALAVMLTGATFGGCCFAPVLGILASVSGQAEGMEGAYLCVDMVVALLIAGLQYDIHRRLEIVATQ